MIATRLLTAPALLAAGALFCAAGPAAALHAEGSAPVPLVAQEDHAGHTAEEVKLMGRWLMERVEDHRLRLVRLDKLIEFYRSQGDLAKMREIERLRQREITAFQATLAEYRRQLGNQDFERLARVMRFLMERDRRQRAGVWGDGAEDRDRSAATRPAEVARTPARPTPNPSTERSLDRQLQIERARASQRMQLAQRLQQAREQQLRLMAEQQRRYRPSAGPAPQGGGPVRPAATEGQGGPTRRPAGATPQRPPQRRRP